jgi:chromosome partitioning protein
MVRIVAFYSIKGGVGKTSSCVNVAYAASVAGKRTLLIDLDPQGASSYLLKVKAKEKHDGQRVLDGGKALVKLVRESEFPGLDILPSDLSYRDFDLLLQERKHKRRQLQEVLSCFADEYDLVFLDCPPNITLLSENILKAADLIVVPIVPTTLSMLSLQTLLGNSEMLSFDPSRVRIFVSMADKRKKLHLQTIAQLMQDPRTLVTVVPYCSEVEKMGLHREPVQVCAKHSKGAQAFDGLWKDIEFALAGIFD